MTSKSAFCLFPTNRGVTGLFPCRKPWRSWRSFVVLATTLMEDVCMQPVWLPKRPDQKTHPKILGGPGRVEGDQGPICPQFSSKNLIISPSPRQTCTSWRTAWQWSFQTFRGNGVDGSPVSGYSLMHLHRRSSQRQEPCAPKVPGREDICRCQLVWQLHVEIWIYKSSTPSSLEIYWIFVFIQFHSPCNQDGTLR